MSCELCGHPFAQKHRVLPGVWGGTYDPENVIALCPNHHAAIHFLMRWYYHGADPKRGQRALSYADDRPLWLFWLDRVRPVVQRRMAEEGRWHRDQIPPYPSRRPGDNQRLTWQEREKRILADEDRLYRLFNDAEWLVSKFGSQLAEMRPEDLRSLPLMRQMGEVQFSMVLGYLIGSGAIPSVDGYYPSIVLSEDRDKV